MLIFSEAVSTVGTRLREAMDLRGVDQTSLAEAVGITQGAISLILKGKTRKSKHLPDLARQLKVSLPWLMGYDEPMEQPVAQLVLLNPNEQDLIDAYRLLSVTNKKAVEDVTEGLLVNDMIKTGWVVASKDRLDDRRKLVREIIEGLERYRDAAATVRETGEGRRRKRPSIKEDSASGVHDHGKEYRG